MNTTVRSYLIEIARLPSRRTIYEMELSKVCGLELEMKDPGFARAEMARIIKEINVYEASQSRPLLGSIVNSKAGDYLENLLFETAEKCKLPGWQQGKADINYVYSLRAQCYDFWQGDKNYLRFK